MVGVGLVIFVSTALVVGYEAGWPNETFPAPGWSLALFAVAWTLVIVGSVLGSG
jgi:hypothetical protein